MQKLKMKPYQETKAIIRPLEETRRKQAEAIAGVSMEDVRVHYQSDLPSQIKARAVTYGEHIALQGGNEHDLDHEIGHVIQQKLHTVQPQAHAYGVDWNLSDTKEKEATRLGTQHESTSQLSQSLTSRPIQHPIAQAKPWNTEEFGDFIMKEHSKVIEKTSNKLVMSFRRAGKDTIERMRYGSAHKGHNVLEKSIKEKTLKQIDLSNQTIPSADPLHADATLSDAAKLSLLNNARGLVGHWQDKMRKLAGIYVSDLGIKMHHRAWNDVELLLMKCKKGVLETSSSDDAFKKTVKDAFEQFCKIPIRNIKDEDPNKEAAYYMPLNDAVLNFVNPDNAVGKIMSKLFVTGDYDLHDIGVLHTVEKPTSSTSHDRRQYDLSYQPIKDEDTTLSVLDNALQYAGKEPLSRDYKTNDMSYIRHGVQFNYPDFMKSHEQGKKMAYAQLNADPDLLFYNPIKELKNKVYYQWYHTANFDDLRKYYKEALNFEMPKRFGLTKAEKLQQARLRYDNLKQRDQNDKSGQKKQNENSQQENQDYNLEQRDQIELFRKKAAQTIDLLKEGKKQEDALTLWEQLSGREKTEYEVAKLITLVEGLKEHPTMKTLLFLKGFTTKAI